MPAPRNPGAPAKARDLIDSLGRGLRVIEAFSEDHPRLSASEVGALTGITRTAARRHLLTLAHFGYAAGDGKLFWLTPRVLRLGQSYLGAARLPRLVQPFIQQASLQCGETVNVSVLDGHEVVYVARSNPPRWVSIGHQVGARVPAHVVTAGVVMLSTLPEPDLEDWIDRHDFSAFTALTVTAPASFRTELQEARTQGYWITFQQLDVAFAGISVPLINRKGECKAAMGMTVVASHHTPASMRDKLLPLLQETAQTLRPLL